MPKAGEVVEKIRYGRESAIVSLGIFLADLYGRQAMTMHVDDTLPHKAEVFLPSALVPAEISDDLMGKNFPYNHVADGVVAAGLGAAGLSLAKKTTSPISLALTGIGAQAAGTAANEVLYKSGSIGPEAAAQKDDGISAIAGAWAVKGLIDRAVEAKSSKEKTLYLSALGLTIGTLTVGSYYGDPKNALTNVGGHLGGIFVGGAAAALERSWPALKKRFSKSDSNYDTAPEALAA